MESRESGKTEDLRRKKVQLRSKASALVSAGRRGSALALESPWGREAEGQAGKVHRAFQGKQADHQPHCGHKLQALLKAGLWGPAP